MVSNIKYSIYRCFEVNIQFETSRGNVLVLIFDAWHTRLHNACDYVKVMLAFGKSTRNIG